MPLTRALPRAAAALLLPCLGGILLRMAGADFVVFVVGTILAGLLGLFVALRSLEPRRGWIWGAFILLYPLLPFVVAGPLTEARAIGPILDIPSGQAGRNPFAAGYRFTDGATPRGALREVVTVVDTWTMRRGGESRRQDTYVVAPVLPPDWRPNEPVAAVAIVASRSETSRRIPDHAAWELPGGLLRLLDDDLQTRAVRRALQQRGLTAADDLLIGTWEPSPGWARVEATLPALILLGVTLAILLSAAVFDRRVPARRR